MKNHKKNRRQRIAEKAARLQPAETKAGKSSVVAEDSSQTRTLGPSTSEIAATRAADDSSPSERMPRTDALSEEFEGRTWFGCRPVLVVIVGLSVLFIVGIAILISRQP